MTPDPKWLDIFKDSDSQLAIAAACGLFLLLDHWEIFLLPDWVIPLVWFCFLLFGCLTAVALLPAWLRTRG